MLTKGDGMSDEDLTTKLRGMFGSGGLYQNARDSSSTLRGSLEDRPPLTDLPILRLGSSDDTAVDLALGRVLGEGGVGVVSLARQNALKRDVAVKKVRSKNRDASELLHEALMMGIVEHPNVVPVHLVGRDAADGSPVIVMKRVEGVTWADVLANPSLAPAAEVADLDYHLRVLLQLCHAVRFAHASGVVHLDIKPGNVMLGSFGEVYLADWGIATRIASGDSLQSGSIRGTPSYMAPEMADPDTSAVDVRTDVFLLGATLHRVITGRRLHDGHTPMDTVKIAHEFSGLQIAEGLVDPELADITAKAVSPNPADRFQSVEEFQDAIRDYLNHRESRALARIAQAGVDDLKAAVEGGEDLDQELLTETRFALRRALEGWEGNTEAAAARNELAQLTFNLSLEHEDLKEAERSLRLLPEEERAALQPALDEARSRKERERAELEELRSRRDQLTGYRARFIIALGASLIWCSIAGFKAWSRWGVPLDEVDPNYLPSLIPTFAIPIALLIYFRGIFFTTEFNRRLLLFFMGGIVAVASIRVLGWALDLHAYITTAMEFVMYTAIAFFLGTITDLRVTKASVLIGVAAVLAVAYPGYQYAFMFVAFAIFAPYIGWMWANVGREAEA